MPSIKGDALVATLERYSGQALGHGFHHQHCERDTGYDRP